MTKHHGYSVLVYCIIKRWDCRRNYRRGGSQRRNALLCRQRDKNARNWCKTNVSGWTIKRN